MSRYNSGAARRRRFGALRSQAVRNAASSMSGGTLARSTRVAPMRPHPPGTGEKIFGLVLNHSSLLLRRKHQYPVTLRRERERGEDLPAHPKVSVPEVRAFDCLGQA